jgi:hypothetical protein
MPHECTNCGRSFPDGSKEMLSGCPDCGGNKFRYRPEGGRLDAGGSGDSRTPGVGAGDPPAAGENADHSRPDPDAPGDGSGGPDAADDDPPGLRPESSAARRVGNAASTLRDLVGGSERGADAPDPGAGSAPDAGSADGDPGDSDPPEDGPEDAAQASARSSVVDPDEIAGGAPRPGADPSDAGTEPTPSAPTGADATAEDTAPSASGPGEPTGEDRPTTGPDASTPGADAGSGPPADDDATADDPDLADLRRELNDQFESIKIVEPGQYELNLMGLYDRDEYIISLKEDGRYVIEVPESWRGDG